MEELFGFITNRPIRVGIHLMSIINIGVLYTNLINRQFEMPPVKCNWIILTSINKISLKILISKLHKTKKPVTVS